MESGPLAYILYVDIQVNGNIYVSRTAGKRVNWGHLAHFEFMMLLHCKIPKLLCTNMKLQAKRNILILFMSVPSIA